MIIGENELLAVLKDKQGKNWGLYIMHDGFQKYIHTREVEQEGVPQIEIKSFAGPFKVKVSTDGQIITYPLDSLG